MRKNGLVFLSILFLSFIFLGECSFNGYFFEYDSEVKPEYAIDAKVLKVLSGNEFVLDYFGREENFILGEINIPASFAALAGELAENLLLDQSVLITYADKVRNAEGKLTGYLWLPGKPSVDILYNLLLVMYGIAEPQSDKSEYCDEFTRKRNLYPMQKGGLNKHFLRPKAVNYTVDDVAVVYPDLHETVRNDDEDTSTVKSPAVVQFDVSSPPVTSSRPPKITTGVKSKSFRGDGRVQSKSLTEIFVLQEGTYKVEFKTDGFGSVKVYYMDGTNYDLLFNVFEGEASYGATSIYRSNATPITVQFENLSDTYTLSFEKIK